MIGQSGAYYGVIQEAVAESKCNPAPRLANPKRQTDEELMSLYISGSSEAFSELFRRYAPVLERILWRSLRDEVPDFVQQTFLHLHRARSRFIAGSPFRPWLLSIAINLQREHFRRVKRRTAAPMDALTLGPHPLAGPDIVFEARRACDALGGLPRREREVLELLCGGGLSTSDIATQLGTTTAGVKSLAHRARQRLRAAR
ncbi:MAG TPA: RNA polymerase sigma factor [Polyangiaceae bacterium]|jgi:RNA polymerase sigma-70 factor (ECF subfamily)